MSQSVKITVAENGTINLEAMGVQGPSCLSLLEPFQKALGGTSDFERKPEFTAAPDVTQNQQAEAGQ
jgi:hypothetical protein